MGGDDMQRRARDWLDVNHCNSGTLASLLEDVRNEALEEAARVCDAIPVATDYALTAGARLCRDRIRALKQTRDAAPPRGSEETRPREGNCTDGVDCRCSFCQAVRDAERDAIVEFAETHWAEFMVPRSFIDAVLRGDHRKPEPKT